MPIKVITRSTEILAWVDLDQREPVYQHPNYPTKIRLTLGHTFWCFSVCLEIVTI